MSEEDVLGGTPNPNKQRVSLSLNELKELMAAAVSAAVEKSSETSAKMISEALLESRKPYVDPRQIINEKAMRDQMRVAKERIDREIKESQDTCQHLQGSNALSDFSGQLTAIVMHTTDVGEVLGICTNCQRVFRSSDEDAHDPTGYYTQMRRKSGNKMSLAGRRFFNNPDERIRVAQDPLPAMITKE